MLNQTNSPIRLARRAAQMNPSAIREILKLTERPGVISLAGGLPAPEGFPVEALREATERVMRESPREALQYAASEGHGPLREWLVEHLRARGLATDAAQILITTGSQQALDLVGKVLLDPGSRVAVESPTYLGALQAFAPAEPSFAEVPRDAEGPMPERLGEVGDARFFYIQPNFQNPGGHCIGEARRAALVEAAQSHRLPLVEDNPYGELWFEEPPPQPMAGRWPEGSIYLGSFSKVLAPGLRVGYLVAPAGVYAKLLQAKQAADLHTPSLNQRIVFEAVRNGLLDRHLPAVRAAYRLRRDAMQAALQYHLPAGCKWVRPSGGMFFWVELPPDQDAGAMLAKAVERGVAYVPGAAFYFEQPNKNTLRLSFATVSPEQIATGVAILADLLREEITSSSGCLPQTA
ncbi:MAG: PLP-dependent aminotransferase family protein [Ideonella sp.]